MPKPVRSDQKYLPGLDGLRALAVAAVIAYHLGYGWAQGGLLGVGVFFTLSGYLITDILVGQWAAHGRIRLGDFWLRRARRLLPALLVMLTVVSVWVVGFRRSFVPGFRGDVVAAAAYVSNWWYIGQHASYYARFAPPGPLDHLWSLAVEEQFYLVWPWLILLLLWLARRMQRRNQPAATGDANPYLTQRSRYRIAGVALVLAAASAIAMTVLYHPGYDPTRIYEGTDTRAFGLLIGAAVALVWPTRRSQRAVGTGARLLIDVAGLAGLAVIGVLIWRTNQYSGFMFQGGLVLLSVATAAVVAAVVTPGSWLGHALGIAPLRWLGVRSYGIYLWHYPVIVLTAAAGTAGEPVSPGRAVAVVAGTVLAAAVSWTLVEEPIRSWARPNLGRPRPPGPGRGRAARPRPGLLHTPQAVAALCLLMVATTAAGVTASMRLASSARPVARSTTGGQAASTGNGSLASTHRPSTAHGGDAHKTKPGAGKSDPVTPPATARSLTLPANVASWAVIPALPTPPPRTSCTSVVHIGDSTSEGLISADYEPNPANRIPARYADVGVKHSVMKIVGATSVVESLPGTLNAFQMAQQVKASGFTGCWVLALGTNDTADVYVGSNVNRVQRIEEMMKLIGKQPVMWVEVTSLLSSGPYSEQNMQLWNQALRQELPKYPNMRVYEWPAVAQSSWFINDGIHYTSEGYMYRGKDIADALAQAFPAG